MKYNVNLTPDLQSDMTNVTKLDALNARRVALIDALNDVQRTLEGLAKTSCGLTCAGCGTVLETEADFAGHFVVKRHDLVNSFLNLGECPQIPRS